MNELIFEVTEEAGGGYVAECVSEAIFTQADTWMELRGQVLDAVYAYHFDQPFPQRARLRFVHNEVLRIT